MTIIEQLRDMRARLERAIPKLDEVLRELECTPSLPSSQPLTDSLTRREKEIFELISQGLDVKQIADKIGKSKRTVETHRENMRKKLGLKSSYELTQIATRKI